MTGAYLRIKRGDKYENIEVEHLTDKERETLFIDRSPVEIINWLNVLSAKLAEHETLVNELVEDGILQKDVNG